MFRRAPRIRYILHGLKRSHLIDTDREITLGRDPACDITIPHSELAPKQIRFEWTDDGELLLFSISESVPTRINGYPVEFKKIDPGDVIKVGSLALTVDEALALGYRGAIGRFFARDPGRASGHTGRTLPTTIEHDGEFRDLFVDSLRRTPWVFVSLLVHLALIILFSALEEKPSQDDGLVGFFQGPPVSEEAPLDLEDHDEESSHDGDETLDPSEPELDPPSVDPFDAMGDPESDQLAKESILGLLPRGSAAGDLSGETLRRVLDPVGLGPGSGNGSKGWRERVTRLRHQGMDIVVLFDSTGSMEGFIREVKGTIRDMLHVLERIVPDLTLCLMTYKGEPSASAYVVANTPMVGDRYELLNFMRSVRVSGGSAEGYSAIGEALDTAMNDLVWRKGTVKTIVLIGDASCFREERNRCLELARGFKGSVSTIYKASSMVTRMKEPETVDVFRRIAAAGGGHFIRHDSEGDIVRRIVTLILGQEFAEEVNAIFDSRDSDRWMDFLRRKRSRGDLDWFIRQFRKRRVRSELIDALIEVGDKRVAKAMWRCIRSEETPTWLLQRSLYVLQSFTGLDINYMTSRRDRLSRVELDEISSILRHTFGKDVVARNN